ncbi:unnamed protein product [Boreogadus saida]
MVSRRSLLLLGGYSCSRGGSPYNSSLHQPGRNLRRKMRSPRDSGSDSALERLQKSVNEIIIIIELNVLKELQALQDSDDCNALGGVLGSPNTADENSPGNIRENAGDSAKVWLGVNDMVTEGLWVDQTGTGVAFKNWDVSDSRSPQPDGGAAHNCAFNIV